MSKKTTSKIIKASLISLKTSLGVHLKLGYTEENLVIKNLKYQIEQLEKGKLP